MPEKATFRPLWHMVDDPSKDRWYEIAEINL
jgi:hypothetical protein